MSLGQLDEPSVTRLNGMVDRLDTFLYVSRQFDARSPRRLDPSLAEALVVELAGWNLDFADRLPAQPDDVLFAPFEWLARQASPRTGAVRNFGMEARSYAAWPPPTATGAR